MTSPARFETLSGNAAPARAVRRAFDVLQVIARADGPVRFSDVVRDTALSKTTVHRILGTLLLHDFVRPADDGYTVGGRLADLADGGRSLGRLYRLLMPFLVDLHQGVRAAVSLGVVRHGRVSYSPALRLRADEGPALDSVPVRCTAVGRLFLAYERPANAALEPELALIRRRQFAYGCTEHHQDSVDIAAPIMLNEDRMVTGIRVICRRVGADQTMIADRLVKTAWSASTYLRRSQTTHAPLSPTPESR